MRMSRNRLQHKSFSLVKDLQPQYASFLAISAAARHVIPTTGDSVLTVDVGGGLQAERAISKILGSDSVSSGEVACERIGSALELLSDDVEKLHEIIASFESDGAEMTPAFADSLLLENVSFDYANLLNRSRKGALLVAGDSVLVLECEPPAEAGQLANQIESCHPNAILIHADARSGLVTFKGSVTLLKEIQSG